MIVYCSICFVRRLGVRYLGVGVWHRHFLSLPHFHGFFVIPEGGTPLIIHGFSVKVGKCEKARVPRLGSRPQHTKKATSRPPFSLSQNNFNQG